jgi:hypothetical protein
MNAPKTLTEAKEQLESAQTRIAQLETLVQGHDLVLESFGIQSATDEKGVTNYASPRLAEAESKLADAIAANKTHIEATCKMSAELAARDATIAANVKEIADLKAATQTVEARARELLSLQGGKPLAVDGADVAGLTSNALRTQLQTEKDPVARHKIWKDLKAQEAKENKRP